MAIAYLGYKVDSNDVVKAENRLDNMSGAAGGAERSAARIGKAFAAAAAATAVAAGLMFRSSISEARKFETAMLSIDAVISATGGAAGRTADQLREQARSIGRATLESTEGVLKAQQTLLTFRKIQGDVFDDTIKAAADMSAALGVDMNSAVLQLGKALEDPITGMTALTRSGTVFTQAQKDMVRQLVETGRQAEAQAFILSELEAQYGGTAEAAASGLAGAQDSLGQSFQELKLEIADSLGLLTLATAANNAMVVVVDFLAASMDSMRGYVIAAAGVLTAAYTPAIYRAVVATGAWIVRLITLRGALISIGVGALVVGAGMLINQFIKLIERTGSLGEALKLLAAVPAEVFERIGYAVGAFRSRFEADFMFIQASALETWQGIQDNAFAMGNTIAGIAVGTKDAFIAAFSALPNAIGDFMFQAANAAISGVEGMINGVVVRVNNFIESINAALAMLPDWATGEGGVRIGAVSAVNLGGADNPFSGLASSAAGEIRDAFSGAMNADYTGQASQAAGELAGALRSEAGVSVAKADALGQFASAPIASIAALRQAAAEANVELTGTDEQLSNVATSLNDTAGATREVATELTAAQKAAKEFADQMSGYVTSAVDGVANAFGDFVARGFRDFKGFTRSILDSFKQMLSQMISLAAKNQIMIGLGIGGAGGVASGAGGMLSNAMGSVIGGFGPNAAFGGGIGATLGSLGGGTGFLGGLGNVLGGLSSGGLSGGLGAIGTALGGATSGLAGLASAAGAIALPLAAAVAVFSFFKKKTKELDSGIRVAAEGFELTAETFRKIETSRFWGLSKKVRETFSNDPSNPLLETVGDIQSSVAMAARVFGLGASAFDDFSYSFKLSLKGLTEDQQLKAITDELSKMGDEFASIVPNFENMNDLINAANQAISETAALGSTRFESQMLAAARRRGEVTVSRGGPGFAEGQSLLRLQELKDLEGRVEENTRQNNSLTKKLVNIFEKWEEVGMPRGPVLS